MKNATNDLLKPDPSFEKEMTAAVAEHRRAQTRGDADPSDLCMERVIDPSESLGGHNAFYFYCNGTQGRTNYASCLATIELAKKGDDNMRPGCMAMIEKGGCPALKMRARELEAKRALFFIDRRTLVKDLEDRLARSQADNTIRYGKSRRATADLETTTPSADTIRSFESTLKSGNATVKPTVPREKDEAINTDLAGRNLLGDAIQTMMEANK